MLVALEPVACRNSALSGFPFPFPFRDSSPEVVLPAADFFEDDGDDFFPPFARADKRTPRPLGLGTSPLDEEHASPPLCMAVEDDEGLAPRWPSLPRDDGVPRPPIAPP